MTDRKAVIKNADMSEDMQQDAGTRHQIFTNQNTCLLLSF